MDNISNTTWLRWKRKRRNTFIGFVIIGTAVGIDCSVIFSTLYLYLKDLVKTDKPEMYYGLICAIFYLTSAIFGAFSGRWLDKTRKVRYYVNFSLLVQIIGFILYIIHFHPAFLLVGRAICGIGEPFTNVITGEIFRIYDNEGSTRAMLWLASIYSFGFVIGPSLNFLCKGVEFKIGALQINNLNFIGIFMSTLLVVVLIIANILVHDCSAEIDLKEILKQTTNNQQIGHENHIREEITDEVASNKVTADGNASTEVVAYGKTNNEQAANGNDRIKEITNGNANNKTIPDQNGENFEIDKPLTESSIPVILVFKNLVANTDTLLIFIMTFVFVYAVFGSSMILPVVIINDLKWSLSAISLIYVGYGIGYFILLVFMSKYCNSQRSIYYGSVVSIVSMMFMSCLLICFKLLKRNFERDLYLMFLFVITLILSWSAEDVLIRIMLAKRVPSKIQSFTETLRAGVCKFAYIVGSLTVSILYPWLHFWASGILISLCLLLLRFIIRRKYFIDPQEIIFIEEKPDAGITVYYKNVQTPDL